MDSLTENTHILCGTSDRFQTGHARLAPVTYSVKENKV